MLSNHSPTATESRTDRTMNFGGFAEPLSEVYLIPLIGTAAFSCRTATRRFAGFECPVQKDSRIFPALCCIVSHSRIYPLKRPDVPPRIFCQEKIRGTPESPLQNYSGRVPLIIPVAPANSHADNAFRRNGPEIFLPISFSLPRRENASRSSLIRPKIAG